MSNRRLPERKLVLQIIAAFAALLVGCASKPPGAEVASDTPSSHWLADGSIAVARPAPAIRTLEPTTMLGFVPVYRMHSGTWLSLDRTAQTLSLMEGEKVLVSAKTQGLGKIIPGEYQLLHKQTRPVWYAPDSYFKSRKLPVPAKGDMSRFRKGALGDFVLIFNKDTPIHNGPIWSDDVGGVRLGDTDIARIYYLVEIGAPIEVR